MLTSSGQSSDCIDPRRLGRRLVVCAADSILHGRSAGCGQLEEHNSGREVRGSVYVRLNYNSNEYFYASSLTIFCGIKDLSKKNMVTGAALVDDVRGAQTLIRQSTTASSDSACSIFLLYYI